MNSNTSHGISLSLEDEKMKSAQSKINSEMKKMLICGETNVVMALTRSILSLYRSLDPSFIYSEYKSNPKRALTKVTETTKNDGFDNQDNDYLLYVNDIIGDKEGQKFLILDLLGQGTFGQVAKCCNMKSKEIIAVKVIKNKPAYFNQSMMEVTILELV
jgi:dual specificity protein kinase YAK1